MTHILSTNSQTIVGARCPIEKFTNLANDARNVVGERSHAIEVPLNYAAVDNSARMLSAVFAEMTRLRIGSPSGDGEPRGDEPAAGRVIAQASTQDRSES